MSVSEFIVDIELDKIEVLVKNPFTRSELTISTFEEFNSQHVFIEKINKVKTKLRDCVKQASSQ